MASKKRLETVTQAATPLELTVVRWRKAQAELEAAKEKERMLRDTLALQFSNPKEGSNVLEVGRLKLTLTHKVNRSVDEATVETVLKRLPAKWRAEGALVAWKPSLVLSAYRELVAEDEKLARVFDQCLTATCGAPSIDASFAAP
jgi:hypothetical protein